MADAIVPYLLRALTTTAWLLLVVLGPGVAIGAAVHLLAGAAARGAEAAFGFRAYWLAFGWVGTAVHEAGHALFAVLFGHRVTRVQWFALRPTGTTLGEVRHRYDPRSPWQQVGNLFIGVGPLLLGTAVVWLAARALLGAGVFDAATSVRLVDDGVLVPGELARLAADVARAVRALVDAVATREHATSWRGWALAYVAFAVGSSIRLSPPDLAGAARGLAALAAVVLVAMLATLWAGNAAVAVALATARACAAGYAVMLLVLVVNAGAAALVLGVPLAARVVRRLAGR